MSPPRPPTPEELRAGLEARRGGRGYVLEHHGALAAAAPDLHAAYDAMYAALTLTERHLSALEKETVWLGILTATRQAIGTHHLRLFQEHGGTTVQAATVVRLVGYAAAADCFAFVAQHWRDFLPEIDPHLDYLQGLRTLCGDALPWDIAILTLAAVHATLGSEVGVARHVRAAYEAAVPEDKLAEALSLVIWPAGVNRLVDACRIWHRLMATGDVTPSPRYRAWADTPGLGPLTAASAAPSSRDA